MTVRTSVEIRNAVANARETTIGTSPQLRYYSGSAPATTAAAPTGTLLLTITLPSDWLGAASGGVKSLAGSWSGTVATGGVPGYWRIYDSTGVTCHEQGDVGVDGTIDSPLVATRTVTVSAATFTEGNA